MNATERSTDLDALNSLLRGETAAVETYAQALKKFENPEPIAELQQGHAEHSRAVRDLTNHITRFGGTPAQGSGAWGTFAALVTGGAKVLGPKTVLAALRQGEEHGIKEYELALDNADLHTDCKQLIRSELLPACKKHVVRLDRLIAGNGG